MFPLSIYLLFTFAYICIHNIIMILGVWPALRAGEFTIKLVYIKLYFNFTEQLKYCFKMNMIILFLRSYNLILLI